MCRMPHRFQEQTQILAPAGQFLSTFQLSCVQRSLVRKLELYLALLPCSHSIALDLLKANRNTYADHRRLSHQHLTSRGMIDDVISDVGTRLLLSDVESGSRDTKKKGMQYNRRSDTKSHWPGHSTTSAADTMCSWSSSSSNLSL